MNPYMKILTDTCSVERNLESGSLPQSDFRYKLIVDLKLNFMVPFTRSLNCSKEAVGTALYLQRLKWFKIRRHDN